VFEVDGVVAKHVGDENAERARLIGDDVSRVVAQTDSEESSTRARTAPGDIVAVRCARTAVAVSSAMLVVVVAPQTNLKLARSCDLHAQHIHKLYYFTHAVYFHLRELIQD